MNFLKMIEAARRGIWLQFREEGTQPIDRVAPKEVEELFWNSVKKCQPFVFLENPAQNFHLSDIPDRDTIELDAPFEVFSCETLANGCDLYQIPGVTFTKEELDQGNACHCMMIVEIGPKKFEFFFLHWLDDLKRHIVTYDNLKNEKEQNTWTYYAAIFANAMNKKDALGFVDCNHKVKIKTPQGKEFHKVKRVVYIRGTKQDTQPLIGQTIDWSHRWLVRGHWRVNKDKIGKDRAGNYCIKDFTWVVEHERGPEDAPLVHKTRVVV